MEIEEAHPAEEIELESAVNMDEDTPQITSSQDEVEVMVEIQPDELDEALELPPRLVRHWPEVATTRAERYRKEVNGIREQFHDDAEDDLNMCPEYADEIFQYMGELEVRSQTNIISSFADRIS